MKVKRHWRGFWSSTLTERKTKPSQKDRKQHQVTFHLLYSRGLVFKAYLYLLMGILSSTFLPNSKITLGLPVDILDESFYKNTYSSKLDCDNGRINNLYQSTDADLNVLNSADGEKCEGF